MISKFVLLFTLIACAHSTPEWVLGTSPGLAAPLLNAPVISAPLVGSAALIGTGISNGVRTQDAHGNYAFNYGIADGVGATNSRAESGDAAGNVRGTYTLRDIDGRARRVDYAADALGFRAAVRTNEPGTAMSAPAAASVVSPYGMPVPPAPVAIAPIAAAPVLAAAAPVIAAPAPIHSAAPVAAYSTGISSAVSTQDAIGNYAFNYGIADGIGATNSRAESGDAAGNVRGTYTLRDIDGRARRVDYAADALGFRAAVRTNEPGTAMSAPAATSVVSPYGMPVSPAPIAAAPVVAAAAPFLTAAGPVLAAAAPVLAAAPVVSTGISNGVRTQDAHGNYAFNYGIADGIGATNSRAESGDAAGNVRGTYTLRDIDGRARRVDYAADALGFRAAVRTNEPGTAMSAPAAASVVSPYGMPIAPAPIAVAPGIAAAPVAFNSHW